MQCTAFTAASAPILLRRSIFVAPRSSCPPALWTICPKRRRRCSSARACATPGSSKTDGPEGKENTPGDATPSGDPSPATLKARLAVIGGIYALFTVHNLAFGPGPLLDAGTIGQIVSGATDEVNDLVIAIFYGLGVVGLVYGGLLAPGAGKQTRLSTPLFSFAGIFAGFFGLGPYLAARDYAPAVSKEEFSESGPLVKLFESKFFALPTLGMALYVYALGLGLFAPSEMRDVIFYACWQDTARLFASDRGIHATLIDGSILSLFMWGPLTEDMRRRGWRFDSENKLSSFANAVSILAAPVLGPALYLVLRPALPSTIESYSDQDSL